MDKDHRLDAPDNESLRIIEQVGEDRSNLSNLYPNAQKEWAGKDLLSWEAREEKKDQEQLQISLSIRKWFAIIGVLTPLPFVLAALLFTTALTFIQVSNMALLILPVVGIVALWIFISYKSLKGVFTIFYEHSLKATPFIVTLLMFIVFSLPALYMTMDALYTDSLLYNSIISSVVVLVTSVALSGILIMIWTSPRLHGAYKIGCIGIFAGLIGLVTLLVSTF